MRCFSVGVLSLGVVAPASAARVAGSQGNLDLVSVDPGVWLTEGCQTDYDPIIGFQVGDLVQFNRLNEDDTAKPMHNKDGVVRCPSPDFPDLICLETMGCWEPKELKKKKMSAASVALVRLSEVSAKFAGAVVVKAKDTAKLAGGVAVKAGDKAKLAGASVKAALAPFANMIMTKVDKAAKLLWKQINPCSKEVQARYATDMAYVKMQVSRLAHSASDSTQTNLLVVRDKVVVVTQSMGGAIAKFSTTAYDNSLKPKVNELTAKLTAGLEAIRGAIEEKAKEARETKLVQALETFTQNVAEFAGLIVSGGSTVYHSAPVQALLFTLQDGAGKLLATAAAVSEDLREQINDMALDQVIKLAPVALEARDKVKGTGRQAVEAFKAKGAEVVAAVNPCDPAVREKAANTVQEAFEFVVAQVQTLNTAVKDRWPAVKESTLLTALTMQGYAEDIAESVKDKAGKAWAWSSPKVQDLVTQIHKCIESLRALAEKTTLADVTKIGQDLTASVTKIGQDLTAKIQSLLRQLAKETEDEETEETVTTGELDDEK